MRTLAKLSTDKQLQRSVNDKVLNFYCAKIGRRTRRLAEEWNQFEKATPGMDERLSVYEEIADKFKPSAPHYYLGAIGVDPSARGLGIGTHLLKAFCECSASDYLSCGVYLETAVEANLSFYERAGFAEIGRGTLDGTTLWCMYFPDGKQC